MLLNLWRSCRRLCFLYSRTCHIFYGEECYWWGTEGNISFCLNAISKCWIKFVWRCWNLRYLMTLAAVPCFLQRRCWSLQTLALVVEGWQQCWNLYPVVRPDRIHQKRHTLWQNKRQEVKTIRVLRNHIIVITSASIDVTTSVMLVLTSQAYGATKINEGDEECDDRHGWVQNVHALPPKHSKLHSLIVCPDRQHQKANRVLENNK